MSKNCLIMVLSGNDNIKRNDQQINTFYCPVLGCKYNLNFGKPSKSFKTQKLLKQVSYSTFYNVFSFYCNCKKYNDFILKHCIKVHSDKKYKCDNCDKGFPLESTLKSHRVTCGVRYSCYCGVQYKSPEAFLTHTKRKQHNIGLGYSTIMKFVYSSILNDKVNKYRYINK